MLQQDYDVLLSPTLATPPVKLGKLSLNQDNAAYEKEAVSASAYTMLYNATGQPAVCQLSQRPRGVFTHRKFISFFMPSALFAL